jgi:hypothetical protein
VVRWAVESQLCLGAVCVIDVCCVAVGNCVLWQPAAVVGGVIVYTVSLESLSDVDVGVCVEFGVEVQKGCVLLLLSGFVQ